MSGKIIVGISMPVYTFCSDDIGVRVRSIALLVAIASSISNIKAILNNKLKEERNTNFDDIITCSKEMLHVIDLAKKIAKSETSVRSRASLSRPATEMFEFHQYAE